MVELRARGDNRAEAYLERYQKLFSRKSVWSEGRYCYSLRNSKWIKWRGMLKLIANGVICVTEAAICYHVH
jgi:glutamate dehydrogenase (NADP+)